MALDRHWPAVRVADPVARWHMPFNSTLESDHLDRMFQSPVRSRVLLFVAAVGETNLRSIYTTLGLGDTSVWLAVNHWEKQGVLRSRRFLRNRLISLDSKHVIAPELRALLRAIIATSDEYDDLRAASRTQQRLLLESAGANTRISRRKKRKP